MTSLSCGHLKIRVWQFDTYCGAWKYAALWDLLSPEEQQRALKFHFEADRRRAVIARGNLRALLAKELNCAARDLELFAAEAGKPELRGSHSNRVHFNVSHSGELVLIALADCGGGPVGVDVEKARPDLGVRELAQRFYCAAEWQEIRELQGTAQDEAFFRCWTRKEAIIKAVGKGLQVPLSSFYVGSGNEQMVAVQTGDGCNWKVCSWSPSIGYAAAVAAKAGDWELKLHPIDKAES